jgi:geranylgeranyl diphosphate synthase type II
MQRPEALRALFEEHLAALGLTPELHGLQEAMRYALDSGGKRIRPVLVLATAEAAGGEAESALAAASALELVHTFSLVHDDLPGLDDDDERRGRPATHVAFGVGIGVLAGDALLAEALRLTLGYPGPEIARELVQATLGMIGGQYLDIRGEGDTETMLRLKTGCLFSASVGLGLWAAGVPASAQAPWRAFGDELGLLFQLVDDLLDGDGFVALHGAEEARAAADAAAERAHTRLAALDADTSVLEDIVASLAARTV